MSGLEDYTRRAVQHRYGAPPVGPARNVGEVMADAEAAHARGESTGLPAGNLGWLLGLWYKGPVGRGVFLLFTLIPLVIVSSGLPGLLSLLGSLVTGGVLVTALAMIGYGALRALLRRRG